MESYNIKDIARLCGVGVSTVSRVLNDHPDVSEKTKQIVHEAIKKYNYIPNNSARNLALSNSNSIGVLVKGISNHFFTRMIKVIEEEINKHHYTMVLHHIDTCANEIAAGAALVMEKKLQGIIFLGGRFNHAEEEMNSIPVPFVFSTCTNTFGSADQAAFSSVAIDDKKEARRAIDYIYSLGHQKIAILAASKDDNSISELRFEGYCEALTAHGIDYDENLVELTGNFNMKNAYDAVYNLLDRKADFTCLFAISDTMAIAACRALNDRGLHVPDDISVMGIDGIEFSSYYNPPITTLKQPDEQMARESVNFLLDRMENNGSHKQLVFETELIVGGSCKSLKSK